MRIILAALAAAGLFVHPAAAQDRPDQKPFFALYKELVETNTVVNVGSCTQAADQVATRMKAAGFTDSEITMFSVPEHPKDGGLVAVLKGSDASAKPMLLLGHIDVVAAKREDWVRDPFKLIEDGGYYYDRRQGASGDLGRHVDPVEAAGLQAEARHQAGADLWRGNHLRVQRRRVAGQEQARHDRRRVRV